MLFRSTLKANALKVLDDGVMLRSEANLVASLNAHWGEQQKSIARKILSRIGPATLGGCIGRPADIRARLKEFADLGIEFFLFKFPPDVDLVRRIGEEVIGPMGGGTAMAAE